MEVANSRVVLVHAVSMLRVAPWQPTLLPGVRLRQIERLQKVVEHLGVSLGSLGSSGIRHLYETV